MTMQQKQNETASAGTEAAAHWTQSRRATLSLPYYSTWTADRQPDWQTSKAKANRSWPATRSLLLGLGFSDPQPASVALDWAGCDVTTSDGRKLSWRNRDRRYLGYRDVTIRKSRPSGKPTEADKLAAGAVDFLLWTWTNTAGAVCDWLLLDAGRIVLLLTRPWPVLTMCDAVAVCISWQALSQAGCIVAASRGVKLAL